MSFGLFDNDRGATALHEAAHAVAAVALGQEVARILLHQQGGRADVLGSDSAKWVWSVIALAPAAFFHPSREEVPAGALSEVDSRALERALQDGGHDLKDVWRATQDLIRRYRPAVFEVARRLLQQGELDGATVQRIVEWAAPCTDH